MLSRLLLSIATLITLRIHSKQATVSWGQVAVILKEGNSEGRRDSAQISHSIGSGGGGRRG
jgi:hypothetical protein